MGAYTVSMLRMAATPSGYSGGGGYFLVVEGKNTAIGRVDGPKTSAARMRCRCRCWRGRGLGREDVLYCARLVCVAGGVLGYGDEDGEVVVVGTCRLRMLRRYVVRS